MNSAANGVLVDSNLLIDIFNDSPDWYEWSSSKLSELALSSRLYINPIIYSEVSIGFSSIETFEACLSVLPLSMEQLPKEALFLTGKAFLQYRKRGGKKITPVPDFFIGAHAAVNSWTMLTRDPARMRKAYPGLEIISPI